MPLCALWVIMGNIFPRKLFSWSRSRLRPNPWLHITLLAWFVLFWWADFLDYSPGWHVVRHQLQGAHCHPTIWLCHSTRLPMIKLEGGLLCQSGPTERRVLESGHGPSSACHRWKHVRVQARGSVNVVYYGIFRRMGKVPGQKAHAIKRFSGNISICVTVPDIFFKKASETLA